MTVQEVKNSIAHDAMRIANEGFKQMMTERGVSAKEQPFVSYHWRAKPEFDIDPNTREKYSLTNKELQGLAVRAIKTAIQNSPEQFAALVITTERAGETIF